MFKPRTLITLTPLYVQSIALSVSLCLSVITKLCGHGSVLLSRQCSTLCNSGFVSGFHTMKRMGQNQRRGVSSSSSGGGTGGEFCRLRLQLVSTRAVFNRHLCTSWKYILPSLGRGAKYCDKCVCMSVSPLTCQKPRPNFTKFSVAVTRSYSDDSAYVMYFRFCGWRCFHIMERMGQSQGRRVSSSSPAAGTGGEVAVYVSRLG